MGVRNIPKSQKKHMMVVVLQAGIEVMRRLVRILEGIQKLSRYDSGVNGWFWHPNTPLPTMLAL